MHPDLAYQNIIRNCLRGERIKARNGEVFRTNNSAVYRFWAASRIPIISFRPVAVKNCLREWQWFLSGSNDINDLHPSVHKWWEPFCKEGSHTLPYNYSIALKKLKKINNENQDDFLDQVQNSIDLIKKDPFSRRNIITTWIPQHVATEEMNPTNCHGTIIQFFVTRNNKLNMKTYQRSCDVIVGLPHNWAQYWGFLCYMAYVCKLDIGFFEWFGGDVHIYKDHLELAKKISQFELQDNHLHNFRKPIMRYEGGDNFDAESFYCNYLPTPIFTDPVSLVL